MTAGKQTPAIVLHISKLVISVVVFGADSFGAGYPFLLRNRAPSGDPPNDCRMVRDVSRISSARSRIPQRGHVVGSSLWLEV
jgi:hypothetical protein